MGAQLGYLTVFALVFYFWINLNIRGAINATAKANIAYFKNCMQTTVPSDREPKTKDIKRYSTNTVTSPTNDLRALVHRLISIEIFTCLDSRENPKEKPNRLPQIKAEFPLAISGNTANESQKRSMDIRGIK